MQEPAPLDPPQHSPGIAQAVLLLVLLWLTVLGAGLLFVGVYALISGDLPDPGNPWLLNIANPVGFFFVTWWGWRRTRVAASRVFPMKMPSPRLAGPILLACISGLILMTEADTAVRLLPLPDWFRSFMEIMDESILEMLANHFWVAALAVVVVAPVTEEVFFRGLLLHGFRKRYGTGKALVASSVFFAVAHLTPNQLLVAFVAGLFFGWLTLRTGSLVAALLAHAAMNAIVLVSSRLAPQAVDSVGFQPWWVSGGAFLALILALRWLHLALPSTSKPVAEETH